VSNGGEERERAFSAAALTACAALLVRAAVGCSPDAEWVGTVDAPWAEVPAELPDGCNVAWGEMLLSVGEAALVRADGLASGYAPGDQVFQLAEPGPDVLGSLDGRVGVYLESAWALVPPGDGSAGDAARGDADDAARTVLRDREASALAAVTIACPHHLATVVVDFPPVVLRCPLPEGFALGRNRPATSRLRLDAASLFADATGSPSGAWVDADVDRDGTLDATELEASRDGIDEDGALLDALRERFRAGFSSEAGACAAEDVGAP
jgi:hypothetical protein